ncbi:MAG: alpha/beta hydrolase [Pseudomonadota bacterium]
MDSVLKESKLIQSFDGEDLYYEKRGEGSPLVFCYGIGCLFNHWTPQIRHFSKRHETLMYDYRGHHKTPIPQNKESLTIEALAQDAIFLCDQLGYKKATFISHSFGGQILLQAYKLRPDLFKHLIFINGCYRNPFAHLADPETLVEGINQIKKVYNSAPELFANLWEWGVNNPLFYPLSALTGGFNLAKTSFKDIEIYLRGMSSLDVRVFITFFEQMIAFDAEDTLSKITAPTLIISGSKDGITPKEEQERMNELMPNSEIYVVPYGSHCTQLDFPEMVNLKIEQFLVANK